MFLYRFSFGLRFEKKNSDSVWNEFGIVQFEKRGSVRILQLFSFATVDDVTLTSLTTTTSK